MDLQHIVEATTSLVTATNNALLALVVVLLSVVIYQHLTRYRPSADYDTRKIFAKKLLCSAKLAKASYSTSKMDNASGAVLMDGQEFCDIAQLVRYQVHATRMEDALWLLKKVGPLGDSADAIEMSRFSAAFVVLIRGTQNLRELYYDTELMAAVADEGCTSLYENRIRTSYLTEVTELLSTIEIKRDDKIEFIGHSWGASVVEAMVLLHSTPNVSGYAFDTPGTPASFRLRHQTHHKNLCIINSVPNLINTLTPPLEDADVWQVGPAINVSQAFEFVAGATMSVKFLTLIAFWCAGTHPMDYIIERIQVGDFRIADHKHWPVAGGFLVRGVQKCGSKIVAAFSSNPNPESCTIAPERVIEVASPHEPNPEVEEDDDDIPIPPEVEEDANGTPNPEFPYDGQHYVDTCEPYRVSPENVSRLSDYMGVNNLIIPLIGFTNVGKTSVVKAICDIEGHQMVTRMPVGPAVDMTKDLTILKWETLEGLEQEQGGIVFVMDMPGINVKDVSEHVVGDWINKTIGQQLEDLKGVVHVACLVVNDADERNGPLYDKAIEVLGKKRVLVIHNVKDNDSSWKASTNQIVELLKKCDKDRIAKEAGGGGQNQELATDYVIAVAVSRSPNPVHVLDESRSGVPELRDRLKKFGQSVAPGVKRSIINQKVDKQSAKESILKLMKMELIGHGVDRTDERDGENPAAAIAVPAAVAVPDAAGANPAAVGTTSAAVPDAVRRAVRRAAGGAVVAVGFFGVAGVAGWAVAAGAVGVSAAGYALTRASYVTSRAMSGRLREQRRIALERSAEREYSREQRRITLERSAEREHSRQNNVGLDA